MNELCENCEEKSYCEFIVGDDEPCDEYKAFICQATEYLNDSEDIRGPRAVLTYNMQTNKRKIVLIGYA